MCKSKWASSNPEVLLGSRPFRLVSAMLAFHASVPVAGCCPSLLTPRSSHLKIRPAPRTAGPTIRAISTNGTENQDDEGDRERLSGQEVRAGRVNDLRERLDRLDAPNPRPRSEERANRYLERESQLLWIVKELPRSVADDCSDYFENPFRKLSAATLAILFGFFAATSASTIIGSVADWDPLAAAVLLVWTEAFTRLYYRTKDKSFLLRLANAFKIGLTYGMAVDAFKLST